MRCISSSRGRPCSGFVRFRHGILCSIIVCDHRHLIRLVASPPSPIKVKAKKLRGRPEGRPRNAAIRFGAMFDFSFFPEIICNTLQIISAREAGSAICGASYLHEGMPPYAGYVRFRHGVSCFVFVCEHRRFFVGASALLRMTRRGAVAFWGVILRSRRRGPPRRRFTRREASPSLP